VSGHDSREPSGREARRGEQAIRPGGESSAPTAGRAPVTTVLEVETANWQAMGAEMAGQSAQFRGLWVTVVKGRVEVRAAFSSAGRVTVFLTRPQTMTVPTLLRSYPAASSDEREAHDIFGVGFAGHEPLRPLVTHTAETSSFTTPVTGDGVHEVAVGPIHAGVIESGHFRFHVVGERILHLDLKLFYNHRGLESLAVGASLEDGLAVVRRACAACNVSTSVAYIHACEELLGLATSPVLSRNRTTLIELERLYNHLNDLGAACAGIGFAAGSMAFALLKERAQRLNARLGGHRFLFDTVAIARISDAVSPLLDRAVRASALGELGEIERLSATAWREIAFNSSVQARLGGVGVLSRTVARELGVVGPSARASGLVDDERSHSPRLAYVGFAPVTCEEGDVAARLELRALELEKTFSLLKELLGDYVVSLPAPEEPELAQERVLQATGIAVGCVEGPRGVTTCALEAEAGRIRRLHLRSASYANWPGVAEASTGALLPDFPLINKSFELCYACNDR